MKSMYVKMPFGKYKGYYLVDLPESYIVYALTEFDLDDELKESLVVALINKLKVWDILTYWCCSKTTTNNSTGLNKIKVDSVYKTLAFKYHPDKGGSNEAMQAINEFKSLLK